MFHSKQCHWEAGQQKDLCTWEERIRRNFVQGDKFVKSLVPGSLNQKDMVCHKHKGQPVTDVMLILCPNQDLLGQRTSGPTIVLTYIVAYCFLKKCFSLLDIPTDSNSMSELKFISLPNVRVPCLQLTQSIQIRILKMQQLEVKLFTLQILDLFFLILKLSLPFSHIYIACLVMQASEVSDYLQTWCFIPVVKWSIYEASDCVFYEQLQCLQPGKIMSLCNSLKWIPV